MMMHRPQRLRWSRRLQPMSPAASRQLLFRIMIGKTIEGTLWIGSSALYVLQYLALKIRKNTLLPLVHFYMATWRVCVTRTRDQLVKEVDRF